MAKAVRKKYSHEELMLETIIEARKSIPEHNDKIDPLVGAIITTSDGEILGRAHRGELREGEHCEYTLIERKLKSHNLRGCVLYVTLEPCTDDSRKPPKRGCSTHIVKARLSHVFVGHEDPNPKIATYGVRFLERKGIVVTMFPDHLMQMIREENGLFFKEKESEALQAKKTPPILVKDILDRLAPGASIDSFSSEAINDFISAASAPFKYPSDDFNQWAEEFGLLERNAAGQLVPTGQGIMLFGKAPEQQFPQTIFKVEIDFEDGKTEIKDFKGPLVKQLPNVLEYVREKALRLIINRDRGVRTEEPDFPFAVLREAIANAVIHRDYSKEGATNYLFISNDWIILRSPGGPTKPITLEELRSFDTPSFSRNPKMMYVFNQMKLAEQRGIGLREMGKLPSLGFPQPIIEFRSGNLEITFGRAKKFISQNKNIDKKLSTEDRELILYIQKNQTVSAPELAEHLKINNKAAQRRLADLVQLGVVEQVGRGRWTRYKADSGIRPKIK